MELDEIIYNAIKADSELMSMIGGRVFSTCIEVPPTEMDNTPIPYIIITDDPFTNGDTSKDEEWESDIDKVQAGVEISAESASEVKRLRKLVRKVVAAYVRGMEDRPHLTSLTSSGIAWDWTKPCYYDVLHYQCDIQNEVII